MLHPLKSCAALQNRSIQNKTIFKTFLLQTIHDYFNLKLALVFMKEKKLFMLLHRCRLIITVKYIYLKGPATLLFAASLRGQSNEIFDLQFFHHSNQPGPLINGFKYFCF